MTDHSRYERQQPEMMMTGAVASSGHTPPSMAHQKRADSGLLYSISLILGLRVTILSQWQDQKPP